MLATNTPFRTVSRPLRHTRPLFLSVALLAVFSLFSISWFRGIRVTDLATDDTTFLPPSPSSDGSSTTTTTTTTTSSSAGRHLDILLGSDGKDSNPQSQDQDPPTATQRAGGSVSSAYIDALNATAMLYADHPLGPPYKPVYGELGARAKVLGGWLDVTDQLADGPDRDAMVQLTDHAAASLFPFLRRNQFSQLRHSFESGRRGVIIPAGGSDGFRFACHLVGALRKVYKTNLPVTIAYAGNEDLSPSSRRKLERHPGMNGIRFLNLWDIFDDETVQLRQNGWATKVFALLAAPWEEVLMLDADAVLLQDPEMFFKHEGYKEKGALLFHDRDVFQWQFKDRIDWWKWQIRHPGPELKRSKMWTKGFPEEGDSGAIVMNKRNNGVLMGLLHAAWQNSFEQREETTYKISYGDKETYWFGLELVGSTYTFSSHYGAMAGWPASDVIEPTRNEKGDVVVPVNTNGGKRICSFTIAHTDDKGKLLWLNGGLLLNKLRDKREFRVPTHWVLDGRWQKGARKDDLSCMLGNQVQEVPLEQRKVLQRSVDVAKEMDDALDLVK